MDCAPILVTSIASGPLQCLPRPRAIGAKYSPCSTGPAPSVHVPVIPSVGAPLARIRPDLTTILAILVAVGPPILPLLDSLGAGGAGGNRKCSSEHCEHEPWIEALHGLGFRVDEGSTIERRESLVQAWVD